MSIKVCKRLGWRQLEPWMLATSFPKAFQLIISDQLWLAEDRSCFPQTPGIEVIKKTRLKNRRSLYQLQKRVTNEENTPLENKWSVAFPRKSGHFRQDENRRRMSLCHRENAGSLLLSKKLRLSSVNYSGLLES